MDNPDDDSEHSDDPARQAAQTLEEWTQERQDAGTGKCNCTFCWKQRMWDAGQLHSGDFRLLSGEDKLADYGKSGDRGEGHHRFCTQCGIATHSHGRIDAMGGDFLSVHLSALDDLPVEDLVNAPLSYADGLHDAWQKPPSETRHL